MFLEDIQSRLGELDEDKKRVKSKRNKIINLFEKATGMEIEAIMKKSYALDSRLATTENRRSTLLDLMMRKGNFFLYVFDTFLFSSEPLCIERR